MNKEIALNVRIPIDLRQKMDGLKVGAYPVSLSELVRRGIELAIAEIETINKGCSHAE